jgi:hypothetical protein
LVWNLLDVCLSFPCFFLSLSLPLLRATANRRYSSPPVSCRISRRIRNSIARPWKIVSLCHIILILHSVGAPADAPLV